MKPKVALDPHFSRSQIARLNEILLFFLMQGGGSAENFMMPQTKNQVIKNHQGFDSIHSFEQSLIRARLSIILRSLFLDKFVCAITSLQVF